MIGALGTLLRLGAFTAIRPILRLGAIAAVGTSLRLCAFAAVFLCGSAAYSQDATPLLSDDRPETLRLDFWGDVLMEHVHRSKEISGARGMAPRGIARIETEFNLRMNAQLWDDVEIIALFRNNRLPVGQPALANDGLPLLVHDLYVRFRHVLGLPALSATLGAQQFQFDLRGRGQAFFFDPYNSESPGLEANTLAPVSFPDTSQPAGAVIRWDLEEWQLAVAWFPAIIEGGPASEDDNAFIVTFLYNLGLKSRAGGLICFHGTPGPRTRIMTIGGGISYHDALPGLELYAEFYLQDGSAAESIISGEVVDVDADGIAFQLGARYGQGPWWAELNITSLSGDEDLNDDKEGKFLSYESVCDLAILESATYGLDLDTNMFLVKLLAGYDLETWLHLSIAFGLPSLQEEAPYNPVLSNRTDDLGMEFDLSMRYDFAPFMTVHGGMAWLVGSEVLDRMANRGETGFLLYIGCRVKL